MQKGVIFTLNFHYEGKFFRDNVICYLGGHEHIVDIDLDKWSFFEAIGIVKDFCQLEYSKYWLWWYNNESYRHSRTVSDSDANEVYKFDIEMKSVVDIYVEHKVVDHGSINVEEVGCVNDDGVNDNGGNKCIINYGDSVVNIEDGVNVEYDGGVNDEYVINAEEDEHGDSDFSDDSDFEANGLFSLVNDEMETNYASDELGFSDPDASD
ncbi:unnamed protein product [Lathyrus sativus]|nr:unnamed protein product [Lathyrus sativus]